MPKKKKPPCSVENCTRPHTARGYCQTHYVQLKRRGAFGHLKVQVKGRTVCSVDGCLSPHSAKGFCELHYRINHYHNLSTEQINLLPKQCQFCSSTNDLVLDHDHACCPTKTKTCGKCIRRVLCRKCNAGVGFLGDSPRIYRIIAESLEKDHNPRLFS